MNRDVFMQGLAQALEWTGPGLSEGTLLQGDSHWDSMGRVATMLFLDADLGVTVTDEQLEHVSTVADVLALVDDRLQ